MNYSVRLPNEDGEACIKGTLVILVRREIILREHKTFGVKRWRAKTEDLMVEILTHEVLHLVILDLEGEIASTALDNICGWDSYHPIIEFGKLSKCQTS